ncbi:hypothetical protein KJK32_46335 (plasmid) [Streptomyces sp. JCM17656]|nr:hypothetical protein KJK32_46335 [Streptomyces sp. JCM17656]
MRKFKSGAFRRGPILAALTLLGSSALTVLPAGSAHAVDISTAPYCIKTNYMNQCYKYFSAAVAVITDYKVNDAPNTFPGYGTSTWKSLRTRMEQAKPELSGILFSNDNWQGNVLIVAMNSCANTNTLASFANVNLNTVSDGAFDNKVESAIGLNDCLISAHKDTDGGGGYVSATASPNDYSSKVGSTNGISSVRFWHNWTGLEALAECERQMDHWLGTYSSCSFDSTTKQLVAGEKLQDVTYNCTLDDMSATLWVDNTVTNGTIYQTEIENKMVLGADFGSIKASFERGVKDIYGRTLTDTSRVAGQKTMTVRPGYKGWMNVIPWAESYGQTVDFTVPQGGRQ